MESLQRYLDALGDQDWERLATCFTDDLHRTGPYGDEIRGGRAYADFLQQTVSALANYELRVFRIHEVSDRLAVVELSETVDMDGGRHETRELLLFELDGAGLIRRVDVYTKQRRPQG